MQIASILVEDFQQQILMANPRLNSVVTAYFDESGKLSDDSLAFGGVVGYIAGINNLSRKWNSRLTDEGLEYTSMKEAINWQGPYAEWSDMPERRDALLLDLARIICEANGVMRIASPMTTEEFKALPQLEKKIYGNDLQYCQLEACIKGALKMKDDFVLHVICDLSEQYAEKCIVLFNKLRRKNPVMKIRCIGIAFIDDRVHSPLQAADMVSYCARAEKLSDRSREYPIVTKLIDMFASQGSVHSSMLYQAGSLGLGDGEIQE